LPDLQLFALESILWPNRADAIRLTEVRLPGDLLMSGSVDPPLSVTPVTATLQHGQSQLFTVTGHDASDILWEIRPSLGSIKAGLYMAPAIMTDAQVIVITAVSRSKASMVGRAMVLVYQAASAGGVVVAPDSSVVTPGQLVQLSTADKNGVSVAVNWTLSPNVGTIAPGWTTGQYHYTAPANIPAAINVTATAVNVADKTQTGVANIQATPTAVVSVKAAQSSAKYGAQVPLTFAVTAGDINDVCWVVYPFGAGSVVTENSSPGKATYTAPAADTKLLQARIVAYLVDDEVAGLGSVDITLTP
jgi:hypothetical protein